MWNQPWNDFFQKFCDNELVQFNKPQMKKIGSFEKLLKQNINLFLLKAAEKSRKTVKSQQRSNSLEPYLARDSILDENILKIPMEFRW